MAVANECDPFYEPGSRLTAKAGAAVTGKRFVDISAGLSTDGNIVVSPASAKGKTIGVASHDVAEGKRVTIIGGGVVPVMASGTIEPGDEVGIATGGKAVKAEAPSEAEVKAGSITKVPAVGRALAKATDEKDCKVLLYVGHAG